MAEKAGYQVSVSKNEGIVEIVLKGVVTKATINSLHYDVINVIQGYEAMALLCDIRNLTGYDEDYASAYFRVRTLPPEVKVLPSAIISQSVDNSFASFYETTASNAGQIVKFFSDIAAARKWLKQQIK